MREKQDEILILELKRKKISKISRFIVLVLAVVFAIMIGKGVLESERFSYYFGCVISWFLAFAILTSLINWSRFDKLYERYKSILMSDYMKVNLPEMDYQYYPNEMYGNEIIRNSNIFNFTKCDEEDVIIGSINDKNFYLSEICVKKTKGRKNKRDVVLFRGLILNVKFPGKQFPDLRIKSKVKTADKWLGNFTKHVIYLFWYNAKSLETNDKQLKELFIFIRDFMLRNKDVAASTYSNEITLFIDNNGTFLDPAKHSGHRSFINEEYKIALEDHMGNAIKLIRKLAGLNLVGLEKALPESLSD